MDAEQMRVLERNPRGVRSQSQRVTERTIIQKPTFLSLQRERIHPVRSQKFERRLAKVNLVPACSRRDFMSEIVSNGVKVRVFIYKYDSRNTRTSPRLPVTLSPCRQH